MSVAAAGAGRTLMRCLCLIGAVGMAAQARAQLFSDSMPLNSFAASDSASENDLLPDLATDGNGNWIAVWQSNYVTGTGGPDYEIFYAVSLDDGQNWSAAAILNTNSSLDNVDDTHPAIASDGMGHWMVVWQSTYSSPNLGTDSDIFFALSSNNGTSWSDPAVVNSAAASDGGTNDVLPQIATDGQGAWTVVWVSGGSFNLNLQVNRAQTIDLGAHWTGQAPINANALTIINQVPAIAYNGDGGWMVVYTSYDHLNNTVGTDADVFAALSNDGLSWSDPVVVNSYAPTDLSEDKNARVSGSPTAWVVVWDSPYDLNGTVGTDRDIMVARSSDGGVSWSAAMALNSTAGTDTKADYNPTVGTDASGYWFVTWTSEENIGDSGTDPDIAFATSRDDGVSWSPASLVNSTATTDTAGDNEDHSRVAAGLMGRWVSVWDVQGSLTSSFGSDMDVMTATAIFPDPFDVNEDNLVNAADIQLVINGALGLDTSPYNTDLNGDNGTNAVDVQLIINEVLNR